MSYDLMVFKKEAAPVTRVEFMKWYDLQTKWTEDHSYDDPANTSSELRNWFMEMIETFPAMNGPFATEDFDDSMVSDYCIGRDLIHVGFAWSVTKQAYSTVYNLAKKHGVGLFEITGNGDILFPENGDFRSIDSTHNNKKTNDNETSNTKSKSWWKFWKS